MGREQPVASKIGVRLPTTSDLSLGRRDLVVSEVVDPTHEPTDPAADGQVGKDRQAAKFVSGLTDARDHTDLQTRMVSGIEVHLGLKDVALVMKIGNQRRRLAKDRVPLVLEPQRQVVLHNVK